MVRIISLHISCILRWSGTYYRVYGSLRTASLHIFCVFNLWGTYSNNHGSFSTTLTHTSCILRWIGTYHRVYGSTPTASLHIPCVLKISGINAKERGLLRTSLLHASWVPGIYFSMYNKIYPNALLTSQSFYLTSLSQAMSKAQGRQFLNDFHNPRSQFNCQNLGCWLYAKQLKQAQDNYQTYTRKDSPGQPFDL